MEFSFRKRDERRAFHTLIAVIPILNFIGKCKAGTEVRSGKNPELSAEKRRAEDEKVSMLNVLTSRYRDRPFH